MTRSELEVCDAIRRDMTAREVGSWLGVTSKTVRWHVHNISEALPRRGALRGYLRVWVWVHRGD